MCAWSGSGARGCLGLISGETSDKAREKCMRCIRWDKENVRERERKKEGNGEKERANERKREGQRDREAKHEKKKETEKPRERE